MQKLRDFFSYILNNIPLVLVVVIALTVALTNIDFNTYYSGWDNIHAEFNLSRYANQVFFGAWMEHQGLGAPASQAHLAEIPRLPILLVLNLLLPDNLVRYVYIFGLYIVGGIGAYLYLSKIWLNDKTGPFKEWIASLGAVFYLLHILTLQQFYISFEMFMVQFAFLPFLLFSLHRLFQDWSVKNLLYFVVIQLLIAPSAHTPTVFYLGVLFSLIYAFFLALKKGFLKAVLFSFLIGFLTLAVNAYWILPNFYYSFNNSHYVAESRENALFATESLWSIREAGSFASFTSNMHYLFSWLDYSFARQGFDFIFNEWLPHLTQPLTVTLMTFLGLITAFGILATAFFKDKGKKRWAFIIFYIFSAALIWLDIFPTRPIIEWLYQFDVFLEAFRNPFTKLSILYSFVLMIFFAGFIEFLVQHLGRKNELFFTGKKTAAFVLLSGFIIIIYISLPTFSGNFISEKLKIKYPDQYWEMFDYFQSKNKNLRMLQLPQFSHTAWVYHDWGFIEPGNGYQGMDFNFFGFPQAMMNRDSDRWVETSDFFYHQLKYALDRQDPEHFADLLNKYNIEIIWIDDTKINAYNRNYDYERDHSLVNAAGFELVWSRDFLHIYEKEPQQISPIYIPEKISWINATDNGRLRQDFVYQDLGDYVLMESGRAKRIYPFLDLMAHQLEDIDFSSDQVGITREFAQSDYLLNLPGFKQVYYQTPAEIKFKAGRVSVVFPKNRVISNNNTITLPQINDFRFNLAEEHKFKEIILFFNDQGVLLDQEKAAHPLLTLEIGQPIRISYAQKREELEINPGKKLNPQQLEMHETLSLEPDWSKWRQDTQVQLTDTDRLTWQVQFPILDINLARNPSENCGWLKRGAISTQIIGNDIVYQADDYGVNCNGYNFDYVSSSYPSVMRVAGSGKQGRGTKLFVSYSTREITGESYMLPESKFDLYLTLHPVTNDPRSQFILNWETRSFGRQSENILNTMQLAPLPLNYAAQLTLDKTLNSENQNSLIVENSIKVEKERSPFPSLHLVQYECLAEKCYLGLDQSYDDLWLGFRLEKRQLANHLRMNNWANLWEVSGSGHLIIFYLPEFVSLGSLFLLSGGIIVLIFVYLKNRA